ncbi:MAG: hypothetical protein AUJ48_00490 [Deltaproteobacteria bacterium CG1_02_45_11]|nr:MAG: hypothetical protein AUJ48_00490 [Deltaproteobacteria bacterium CG1_02_45_11]
MRFSEQTVKLSWIDSSDDTYRITTKTMIDDLVDSIKKVGLINPPILIEKTRSGTKPSFVIVGGFRRIKACQRLRGSTIKARILDSDTSKLECVKLAITDNALQRPLNLIEESRSISMLSAFITEHDRIDREASTLGLPDNPTIIKKITNICRLPWPIQNGILTNTISLAMALELGRLAQKAGVALADLFSDLRLSLSKQREIIIVAKEIALRERISILEVLEDNYLQQIVNSKEFDRTQKTRKIRSYLKQRRFPELSKAEKEFKNHVKELKLGSEAKLIPPHNFEGTTYTLSLYFKNKKELNNHLSILGKIIKNPVLEKILD